MSGNYLGDLLRCQRLLSAKPDAARFRALNAIHVSYCPQRCLKWCNHAQHVEQQSACGIAGVNLLIKHVEVHTFALERLSQLAQMQCRARQLIQTRDHERITIRSRPSGTRRDWPCKDSLRHRRHARTGTLALRILADRES